MNPKDLIHNFVSPSVSSNISITNKETQTSKIYNTNLMSSDQQSSKTPSRTKDKSCNDDNIKVFEFCEVIKDPNDDTVSLVKETFTEEVIKSSDGCFSEKPTHNRYIYCREVVQPYCKAFSKACPKYPVSLEKLYEKNLSKSSQESYSGDKDIDEKTSNKGSNTNMDCNDSKTTFVNPHKSDSQSSQKSRSKSSHKSDSKSSNKNGQKKRPCPPPKSTKKECQQQVPDCEVKPQCPNLDDSKFKEYLSTCINTTVKLAKKGSEACFDSCEKTIGIRSPKCGEEKPTYYVMRKPKSRSESENVSQKSSIQNILESDAVKAIKLAVQDLVCTVYTKTKDAVNLIRTESCRHLGSSENTNSRTKTCASRSLDKVVNIIPERCTGNSSQQDDKDDDDDSLEKIVEPALNAIKKVASVVSSAASIIRDFSVSDIADEYVTSKFNKSSPEDKPDSIRNLPKKLSHDHEPSPNPSVFAMIKTKFFSMFGDKQKCQEDEVNDDDDEQSAEALFEKYCDQ